MYSNLFFFSGTCALVGILYQYIIADAWSALSNLTAWFKYNGHSWNFEITFYGKKARGGGGGGGVTCKSIFCCSYCTVTVFFVYVLPLGDGFLDLLPRRFVLFLELVFQLLHLLDVLWEKTKTKIKHGYFLWKCVVSIPWNTTIRTCNMIFFISSMFSLPPCFVNVVTIFFINVCFFPIIL